MIKRPSFLELATAMHNRGFAVTPVRPDGKGGRLWNQYKQLVTNLSEVTQLSKDYPDHNVGIVSKRGIGNPMFLDIDGEGVLEQIEAETGHKMPLTLVVQSRPQSGPWKRHFYFLQTSYSYAAFKKEITGIADLSVTDAKGKYPNRYDLKGIGGGGYVIAPGSVRENGEVYSFEDDEPVDAVPNWLVNWVIQDVHKFRVARAKLREAEKRKHDDAMQGGPLPEYTKDEINIALWNRAMSYAPLGTRRATIKRALKEQMEDFMKDGNLLAVEWENRIHDIAFDPNLQIGSLRKQFLGKLKRPISINLDKPVPSPGQILVAPSAIRRHEVMATEIKRFPSSLTSPEIYARLKKAVEKVGLTLDSKEPADQQSVAGAMRKAGYGSRNIGGTQMWAKSFKGQKREWRRSRSKSAGKSTQHAPPNIPK